MTGVQFTFVYVRDSPVLVFRRSSRPSGRIVSSVAAPGVQDEAGLPTVTVDGPILNGPPEAGSSASFARKTQWYVPLPAGPSAVRESTGSPTSPCSMTRLRVLWPPELSMLPFQVPR